MKNSTIKKLNKETLLIGLNFHIISGRKKLKIEDLELPPGIVLPPEAVASLGSKKFIDPDEINKLTKLRDQAKTACERVGVKFMGGYAIPKAKLETVKEDLESTIRKFNVERDRFIRLYEQMIDGWAAQNKEWESIIRSAVPAKRAVADFLSADYVVYQVSAPEGLDNKLNDQAESLSSQLYKEVAAEAKVLVKAISKQSKEIGVTQKSLWPIQRVKEKMRGLSFIDSSINKIISYISEVESKLPTTGRMTNDHYNNLMTLAVAMSDPSGDQLKELSGCLVADDDAVLENLSTYVEKELEKTESTSEGTDYSSLPLPEVTESFDEDNSESNFDEILETVAKEKMNETGTAEVVELVTFVDPETPETEHSQTEEEIILFAAEPSQVEAKEEPEILVNHDEIDSAITNDNTQSDDEWELPKLTGGTFI